MFKKKLNYHAWDLKNHSVGCEADGLKQKEVRESERPTWRNLLYFNFQG